jgi:WD40 repeat protein
MANRENELYFYLRDRTGIVVNNKAQKLVGTGAFISESGYFLTCYHLNIQDEKEFFILDVAQSVEYKIEKIYEYEEIDLLIIKTNRGNNLNFLKIDSKQDLIGKEIYAFGYPENDLILRKGRGKINRVTIDSHLFYDKINVKVYGLDSKTFEHGQSGGPVIDLKSRSLVGVIHGYDVEKDKIYDEKTRESIGFIGRRNTDYFIPINAAIEKIDSNLLKNFIIDAAANDLELVKRVSNILELIGYNTEVTDFLDDKSFDIVATLDEGVARFRLLVICMTGGRTETTKEEMSERIAYQKRHFNIHEIVLIVEDFLPPDISKLVEFYQIKVTTETEFLSLVIGIPNYLKIVFQKWENSYDNRYYTPLSGQDLKEGIFTDVNNVDEYLSKWLEEEGKKNLLIIGKFGSGKTTTCKKFIHSVAQKYQADRTHRIPILIKLKDHKRLSIRGLITDLLQNKLKIRNSNFSVFEKLNSDGRFLLVFDGFDEMEQYRGLSSTYCNLKDLSDCFTDNSKIIVTSRLEYFVEDKNVESIFLSNEFTQLINTGKFEVLYLEDFNAVQVEDYIKNKMDTIYSKEVIEIINKNDSLNEISRRPILLKLISETPLSVYENTIINLSSLYSNYIERKFERDVFEERPVMLNKEEKINLLSLIAGHIYKNSLLVISLESISKIIHDHYPNESKLELEMFVHDILLNSFLSMTSRERSFEFSHKSFFEYFIALRIKNEIRELMLINKYPEILSSRKLYYDILKFLKDFNINEKDLETVILYTKNKNLEDVMFIGGNIVSLLRLMNYNFSNKNFDDCVFHEANFSNCNLENISLRNCNLRANFNNSNLKNANFSFSDLETASIKSIRSVHGIAYNPIKKELAAISSKKIISFYQINLKKIENNTLQEIPSNSHNDYVFAITYDNDFKHFATGGRDQAVVLWDANAKSVIKKLKGHFDNIRGVKFFQKFLFSCSTDGQLIRWDTGDAFSKRLFETEKRLWGIDIDNKGTVVCGSENGFLIECDSNMVHPPKYYNLNSGQIRAFSFWGKGSSYIVAGCGDGSVVLFDLEVGTVVRKVSNQKGAIKSLAFFGDEEIVISGSEDGTISVWKGLNLIDEYTFIAHSDAVSFLTIARIEGELILFSSGNDGLISIWKYSNEGFSNLHNIEEKFINDQFDCTKLNLLHTTGLSNIRLNTLKKQGAIIND